jgi:hypothetical protein
MIRNVVIALLGVLILPFALAPAVFAAPLSRGDFSASAIDIDFEGFPTHTQITTQYQSLGVVFTTIGSSPQANNDFQAQYGPLASGNILAAGTSLGSNQIELSFVNPVTGDPAATTGVGADIIFRNTGNFATLEVFDASMMSLGSVTTPPDMGDDEVFLGFGATPIYKAILTFNASDSFVGIDNLIFEPVPEPATLVLAALAVIAAVNRRRDSR